MRLTCGELGESFAFAARNESLAYFGCGKHNTLGGSKYVSWHLKTRCLHIWLTSGELGFAFAA